ncbi:hypothetical protein OLOG_00275 [Ostreococcus lucimarinus virus OlV4]|nr:hypothetical protein OLOG_00275 [Ostreococcus lucimarinus virus OlV4]
MHAILQSVVGGPGPLIVEYNGQMFIENCFTITHKHVNSIHEKLKVLIFQKLNKPQIVRSFYFRIHHLLR